MEAAFEQAPVPRGYVPRAIGTGERLDREALLSAPIRSLPLPAILDAPLTELRGAGPKLSEAAAEIGIANLGDLLRHLPHSYRDRASPVGLGELKLGEEATVEVTVAKAGHVRPTRRRRLTILEADVADDTGRVTATWFNRAWLADKLTPGTRLLLRGKLEKRGFNVSEHELLGAASATPAGIHTTGLVPVHSASERLRAQKLREWAWQAAPLARHAIEPLPARLRAEDELPGAADALVASHFPADPEQAAEARRRLAFEELLLYQASLGARRRRRAQSGNGPEIGPVGERVGRWLDSLPFELTGDQRAALDDVDGDLAGPEPMQRLLMGEVGSGKTVIALYAMLRALEAGQQAALMAPTETLAEQHFRTLEALLASEPAPLGLLTSATPKPRRAELLDSLAGGQPTLVVGTHALIEESVGFASLAVAVVDEQHRFGVRQRAALDAKGPGPLLPHVLHMTATPIPRTLSLTAYGDLDTTALRELPAGRRPIRTWAVDEDRRPGAYEYIRERLREGRQAYVVCPLISDSAEVQARAAEAEAERLANGELRDFRVELLHGRMSSEAKAGAMGRFVAGEAQVLVATTVIEVGVDVPNATVMLVEGAERFGLSQLHQLRGRVGRGEHESCCILFGDAEGENARARLDAITAESDGFRLAEVDLTIRGEGEILGTRQHGLPRFRAAVLPDDTALLLEARRLSPGLAEALRLAGGSRAGTPDGRGPAPLRRRALAAAGRMKLRISGGELGGRRLAGPRRGDQIRPTTERVREAAFSILGDVGGARVLDMFCGTGALGLEALSRGAASAVLVDSSPGLAQRNVQELDLAGRAEVIRSDAMRYLGRAPEAGFDLVLCDPPYGLLDADFIAELDPLVRRALAPGGRVMLESSPQAPGLSMPLLRERRYGETLVRVYAEAGGEGP